MDCFYQIGRKCLFNARFCSFYFHLYLLRNSKVLFARAQRREVCDPLIYCVWHVNFGWLWTNNPTWLQGVSSIFAIFLTSSHYWFHVFDVQLCFVGAQVLETWLTCVCWHVTWNTWIVSIEIVRKCLFNTRFSSFCFHVYFLRNSKVLFARAQRIESGLIVFWHILDVFLTFNLSCVFVQRVRFHEFWPLISLPKHDRL